jgi:pimeloyl-ACP methyl ester carboxylesterase
MATRFVTSADGTRIAYETMGQGARLVFVWGALGVRSSPFAKAMREELAKDFTVFDYDRRGRGESGDTKPYAVAREVEDLRALCEAAGGQPYVAATSSGAALALEAAASGVPMKMLAAHEPPYMVGNPKDAPDPDYEQKMNELIARGKRGEAVTYFMRTVGVPGMFVLVMRFMPFWNDAVAAAHTLPYDAAVMDGFAFPERRLREVRVPTVVLVGGSTTPTLRTAADATARTIPGATERVIPKQNHGVKPAALRPVLVESFRAATDTGSPNAVSTTA